MADRILTFQQTSVIQDIETYLDLSKRGGSSDVLREIFLSIIDLVVMDADLYPEELLPEVFFKGRTAFVSRARRRDIRAYLHRIHKHLDLRAASTLPG